MGSERLQIYIESKALNDFGYFRIQNMADRRSFGELEKLLEPDMASLVTKAREVSSADEADMAFITELPSRPEGDVSIEAVKLSLAEMAGAAAAIRLFTGKESVFFDYTYLGGFARRWAEVLKLEEAPESEMDNWIVTARGIDAKQKLDQHPSLVYKTSKVLFEEYGISVSQTEADVEVVLGGFTFVINKDGAFIQKSGKETSRESLHVLVGFCRAFYLIEATSSSLTPGFTLVDSPLAPFSDLDGSQSVERIIQVDRIKAYLVG